MNSLSVYKQCNVPYIVQDMGQGSLILPCKGKSKSRAIAPISTKKDCRRAELLDRIEVHSSESVVWPGQDHSSSKHSVSITPRGPRRPKRSTVDLHDFYYTKETALCVVHEWCAGPFGGAPPGGPLR